MLKDEDVCLHCGLCAERCPTAAWDMAKFELKIPYAGTTVHQHDRVNDFALKIANRQRLGLRQRQWHVMQAIFRMGVPVSGKNLFPSNIQGLPTWYEIRVSKHGHTARTPDFDWCWR
jgi:ferredoxin